ncbi:hypothetical protein CCMA1212_007399 [Trichoderma ghanense]|uniref:Uncharacterized protein n=1 Tax=Trichoderma ghanense TaxID=65468 RepID=A0ABY2GY33_9HYPO
MPSPGQDSLVSHPVPSSCSSLSFCPPADRTPVPQIAVKEKLAVLIAEGGGGMPCDGASPATSRRHGLRFGGGGSGLYDKCSVDAVFLAFATATPVEHDGFGRTSRTQWQSVCDAVVVHINQ